MNIYACIPDRQVGEGGDDDETVIDPEDNTLRHGDRLWSQILEVMRHLPQKATAEELPTRRRQVGEATSEHKPAATPDARRQTKVILGEDVILLDFLSRLAEKRRQIMSQLKAMSIYQLEKQYHCKPQTLHACSTATETSATLDA